MTSIPTSIRSTVFRPTCYCCDATTNEMTFNVAHINSVANGGKTTLDNLRCICSPCNKAMGSRNMEEFKKTYFSQN